MFWVWTQKGRSRSLLQSRSLKEQSCMLWEVVEGGRKRERMPGARAGASGGGEWPHNEAGFRHAKTKQKAPRDWYQRLQG